MRFPLHPTLSLDGRWTLGLAASLPPQPLTTPTDVNALDCLPARVPGNFELDLLADGRIPEPFVGLNIADLTAYEHHHLYYARRFVADARPGYEPVLRFEGLDCLAEVYLNGALVGRSDNALIPHEFAVGEHLVSGENALVVHLSPALDAARDYDYPPGMAAMRANVESLHVRKAPSAYGWDIMPRALSAGLWRSVSLVWRPVERLDEVYLRTLSANADSARLHLTARARGTRPGARYELAIEGRCGEHGFSQRSRILFEAAGVGLTVARPARWWPRGRGEQALYDVTVRLLRDGEEVDVATFRHGIRTVRLERTSVTTPEQVGEFCFWVNGERLFVLGSNWVPADAYHSRDAERLPELLGLVEELGCNLLRCWGGNVYEHDRFYDRCDELGILVWQDFALACAVYPQDDAFAARLAVEARAIVRRLREHACLALWAGDNECDQAYAWNGLGDPNANRLTRVVLPEVLRAEDPGRVYLPSSPYIDSTAYAAGERFLSENHLWGPRDWYKSDFYRSALCHFASEIGYHGCPAPESVRRFINPDQLWPPDNAEWRLHATSPVPGVDLYDYRIALMFKQVDALFGVLPDSLEEFAELSQVVQAEALKFFIEQFRAAKWRRTGIVWWNVVDGWPQFSDAIVDYYLVRKRAFEYVRRAQQPLLLLLTEADGGVRRLLASNDRREALRVDWQVTDLSTGATVLRGQSDVDGDRVTELAQLPVGAPTCYRLGWRSELGDGWSHYLAAEPPVAPAHYRAWLAKCAREDA